MRIPGENLRRVRWGRTDRNVVAVEFERVIPPDDPREAGYQAETVQRLRAAEERARFGAIAWLKQREEGDRRGRTRGVPGELQ